MHATMATIFGRPRAVSCASWALGTGLHRMAERVAMKRVLRTAVRPPAMALWPRMCPRRG